MHKGSPFLKVKVLRDNPYGLKNVNNWGKVLKENTQYNEELIHENLKDD